MTLFGKTIINIIIITVIVVVVVAIWEGKKRETASMVPLRNALYRQRQVQSWGERTGKGILSKWN